MGEYVGIEVPQSSVCNLDCSYCYIPKNPVLNKIHKKWRHRFHNDIYRTILLEKDEIKDLKNVSFWGAEPTLGIDDMDHEGLLNTNNTIEAFSTSTNLVDFSKTEKWLKRLSDYCENNNRQITVDIQISLDGYKEITDKNRGEGTFDKVMENLYKLNDLSWYLSENMKLGAGFKSTNDISDFIEWNKDNSKLEKYMDTFLNIQQKYYGKWPKNFEFTPLALPTLALPGNYTKQDGIIYRKLHRNMSELANKKNYLDTDQYYGRLLRIYNHIDMYPTFMGRHHHNCSAGVNMISVDPDGYTHGCHGSFWYNYDEYLDTVDTHPEWKEGKRVIKYNKEKFKSLTQSMTSQFRDDLNNTRLEYLLSMVTSKFDLRLATTFSMVKTMALAGQISKIYLKDNWAKLLAYFLVLENFCWLNNMYTTGSKYSNTASLYRIYGNGLFEDMIMRLNKEFNIKEE